MFPPSSSYAASDRAAGWPRRTSPMIIGHYRFATLRIDRRSSGHTVSSRRSNLASQSSTTTTLIEAGSMSKRKQLSAGWPSMGQIAAMTSAWLTSMTDLPENLWRSSSMQPHILRRTSSLPSPIGVTATARVCFSDARRGRRSQREGPISQAAETACLPIVFCLLTRRVPERRAAASFGRQPHGEPSPWQRSSCPRMSRRWTRLRQTLV
jgi:hypothetical protein